MSLDHLLGYQWLIQRYDLPPHPLSLSSSLGTRLRERRGEDGSTHRELPPQYVPSPTLAGHLEFALKHEGVHPAVLFDLFRCCGPEPIREKVQTHPSGKFARLMGFYYELLTGEQLDPELAIGGNYIDALDPERYFVAPKPVRNRRWRVWDNLLGDGNYWPLLRRTEALEEALAVPLQEELEGLVNEFPPELFRRASDYLYLKETRSSYGIEQEPMPPEDRTGRFVALLREAGTEDPERLWMEEELARKQNMIVDPRYAESGFRTNQNYVGETRMDYTQKVHYACPPPQWVEEMVGGLAGAAMRMEGLPAIVRAAAVAFGFVFIHPFEDGNGRLHRFLIHDVLHRDGFAGPGVMLPVSATMLRRMNEYDKVLEHYSRPLMERLAYEMDEEERLTIMHPETVESYYRFPDLTSQAEYLAATIAVTVREDFAEELRFLQGYDTARKEVREIVDMPDRKLDLLLRLLRQNGGVLSKAKRGVFSELTDGELEQIQDVVSTAFHAG